MRKPDYIRMIEEREDNIYSVYSIQEISIDPNKFSKMKLVYLESPYPEGISKELIYQTETPFFIYLIQVSTENIFNLNCYFTPENKNAVSIFLNSLLHNKK